MSPDAMKPEQTHPGQESVWRYPRPPRLEETSRHLRIVHRGVVLAETRRGLRTLETSHPPTYYFPSDDVDHTKLQASANASYCEWKGHARYFDVFIAEQVFRDAAWTYPEPSAAFAMLKNHLAFYAEPFDACFVDEEIAIPQPGGFYGGWITSDLAGPFKGVPGSRFW